MASPAGLDISRPTGLCAATGSPIEPGEAFIATLVELDTGALQRLDYTLNAWQAGARPTADDGSAMLIVAFWRTTMPTKDAPKRQLIAPDELVDLFDQLADATEPARIVFRYVLSLILIRKRLLSYEGSRTTDAGPVMLVRRKGEAQPPERGGDGPPYTEVLDPGMDDQRIAEATEQLGAVILGDGDAP